MNNRARRFAIRHKTRQYESQYDQAMTKIHKLKEWYSIDQATKRLSLSFSEELTQTDILELALEQHIQLYWFMRHVPCEQLEFKGKDLGFVLDKDNKPVSKIDNPNAEGEPFLFFDFFSVESVERVSLRATSTYVERICCTC